MFEAIGGMVAVLAIASIIGVYVFLRKRAEYRRTTDDTKLGCYTVHK